MKRGIYLFNQNKIYLSQEFLEKFLKPKFVDQGIEVGKNGSKYWQSNRFGNRSYVAYDSIPKNFRNSLPDRDELKSLGGLINFIKPEHVSLSIDDKNKYSLAKLFIEFGYHNKGSEFVSYYRDYGRSGEEILELGKKHAAYNEMIALIKSGRCSRKDIFTILATVNFNCNYKFPSNYRSFCLTINKAIENGIDAVLKHGNRNNPKANKIFTRYHQLKAKELFKDPRRLRYPEILDELNDWAPLYGLSTVKLSSLKNFLRRKEIQNECRPFRNGKEWIHKHLITPLKRNPPKHVGSLGQIDGSRFMIPYYDEINSKPDFLTIIVVLDVFSNKVIGHAIGKKENTKLIFEALQNTLFNVKF